MKSLNEMIKRLYSLVETHELSDWEESFVNGVHKKTNEGKVCTTLTEKQINIIERLHKTHFESEDK